MLKFIKRDLLQFSDDENFNAFVVKKTILLLGANYLLVFSIFLYITWHRLDLGGWWISPELGWTENPTGIVAPLLFWSFLLIGFCLWVECIWYTIKLSKGQLMKGLFTLVYLVLTPMFLLYNSGIWGVKILVWFGVRYF